jgi:hypothetical protein
MSDRLEHAFRALRDLKDGASPSSEETLERIVGDLRVRRGARPKVPGTWMLIAAVLAFATAAAGGSARFGHALRAVMGWQAEESSAAPASTSHGQGGPSSLERLTGPPPVPPVPPAPPEPASPGAEQAAVSPEPAPSEPPPGLPAAAPKPAAGLGATSAPGARRHAPRAADTAAKALTDQGAPRPDATSSAVAPVPARPPSDDATYLVAHRLHFGGGDPASALAAWDDYLGAFPQGRFAPEARYNRAIDLLKLRRYDEARLALQPFADDAYGSYHRDEARAILRWLRPGP